MTPLRPWMTRLLTALGVCNIALGVIMVGFYHEACRWIRVSKPHSTLELQVVGAVTLLIGIGYWLAARRPARFRFALVLGFAFHFACSLWIVYAVADLNWPLRLLAVVALTAAMYLAPLAVMIRRLYFSDAMERSIADVQQTPPRGQPRRQFVLRAVSLILLIGTAAPTAWAIAYAIGDLQSRRELLNRPSRWTPLAVNFPASVGEEFPYAIVEAWPELEFVDPTYVAEIPDGTGRMVVVERRGLVKVFPKDIAAGEQPTTLFDISDRALVVAGKAEDGLLGLAFHPQFNNRDSSHVGEVFVRYTSMAGGKRTNRLSRFKLDSNGTIVDPASEQILIAMPEVSHVHKGGSVEFGPDGFLYTSFGTDGRHFPHEHAQRIDHGLFAGILRIDVDCQGGDVSHAPTRKPNIGQTAGYFIPNDNPFVGRPNALEEFYSLGLRNPWRMSIDPKTGLVWVGDVGDRRREEVNVSRPGDNHQFDYREGTLDTRSYQPLAPEKPSQIIGTESPPLFEYERDGINRCVIGGYVYRGKQFPELVGKYIYGDQCGRIYAITTDDEHKFVSNELIAVMRADGLGVSSLGQDADGELYVCWIGDTGHGRGKVFRLARGSDPDASELPKLLSNTGLFADLKSLTPNPSLIEYEVNMPLWSDRAEKRRWIGFVSHEKISGKLETNWRFPAGTVLVKHFDLPLDETQAPTNPTDSAARLRRLETRVLVCDDEGAVYGATYRWNADGSEAYLVEFSTTEEIEYVDAGGEKKSQTWLYPGRFDCLACHNDISGQVLGFNARQLNRDIVRNGLKENQLVQFAQAGMFTFDCRPSDTSDILTLVAFDDPHASGEQRLRSYLDANCSHCHRPGGRFGPWDARYSTPLEHQGIVDGVVVTHRGENPRSRVVRPGDLDFSFLYVRMSSNDRFLRMPPLGRDVVHGEVVELLAKWIQGMPSSDSDSDHENKSHPNPALDEGNDYLGSAPEQNKQR